MILPLLALSLAWAHGGEDHGVPPPTLAHTTDAVEVSAGSAAFEVVLRAPLAGGALTLWIADTETSAPISEGTVSLSLTCDAGTPPLLELTPTATPGTWTSGEGPPPGSTCEGALALTAGGRSDLLEIPPIDLVPEPPPSTPTSTVGMVLAAICAVVAALALGLGFGFALGRRGRATLGLLLLTASAPRAWAHGGHDDAEVPASAAGSGLHVAMASQFLLEIQTARTQEQPFTDRVQATGHLVGAPGDGADLRAPIAGRLSAPADGPLRPGQTVQAGEILGWIQEDLGAADRVGTAASQAETRVRLAEARAALALAERDAARAADLEGVLSERERAARQEALTVAQEAVARLGIAATQGGAATALRAPMDGRLARISARPGDTVDAGEPLFHLVGDGALQAQARLPEALGGHLVTGASAWVLPAALPGAWLPATIVDPGQEVDPHTGTLPVTLQLGSADPALKPGMSVQAWLASGPPRPAVVVPEAAIVESGGQPFVFVKTGPESFELRAVQTGGKDGDRREVLAGLKAGERVVVSGTYVLRSLAGR